MVYVSNETYLEHHGIKGQKWGVRRYQNSDGTLTAAGKRRRTKEVYKEYKKLTNTIQDNIYSDSKKVGNYYKTGKETSGEIHLKIRKDAAKKALAKIRNEYGNEMASEIVQYDSLQVGKRTLALAGIMGASLATVIALDYYR